MLKFCKDCRHFDTKTTECQRAPYRSPVTGAHAYYFAEVERQARTPRACGPEGAHFRERVTSPPDEPPF